MTQRTLILKLLQQNKGATIIGSLGTISKDLLELDNGQNEIIPIKGAMGCVMGVGLGYALSSERKVIVIIGEGSFLMKMGSISTILSEKPKNLQIIILNNDSYQSCGGQKNNFSEIKDYIPSNFKIVNL